MIDCINDDWSIFAILLTEFTHVETKAPAIIKINQFVDAATILCYVHKYVHLHGTIHTHMKIHAHIISTH